MAARILSLDETGRVAAEAKLAPAEASGARRAVAVCEADPAALAAAYSHVTGAGDCPLVLAPTLGAEARRAVAEAARGELPEAGHLLCTSGTTGVGATPRVFFFTSAASLGNARAHVASLGMGSDERVLLTMSMSHSFGLVAAGLGCSVLGAPLFAFAATPDPATLLDALREHAITTVYLTPPLARLLLRHLRRRPAPPLPSLRRLSVGSAAMTSEELSDLTRAFPATAVYFTYGLTELGPRVSTHVVSDPHDKDPPTPAAAEGGRSVRFREASALSDPHDKDPPTPAAAEGGRSGFENRAPIGRPLDGVELDVRPSDAAPEGELHVRSRWAALGRWHDGRITPLAESDGFIATRDAVRVSGAGIQLLGRLDGVIVMGGANVYPEDVEHVADRVEGVAASCLVGRPSPLYGEVPVLVCEPENGVDVAAAVLEVLRSALPPSHVPVEILVRPLPRTAVGKIARGQVRAEIAGRR